MNQLLTCSNVKLVCAAMVRFSSSVGYGCTKCWNSQDLIMEVACFGSTPRFCFLPRPRKSSSSSPDPGDVGDGERLPCSRLLSGGGKGLAPIWERGVPPWMSPGDGDAGGTASGTASGTAATAMPVVGTPASMAVAADGAATDPRPGPEAGGVVGERAG